MSGHSKWATIKHKKAKTDQERGKIFTKLVREITSAVKQGGADQNGNARLRLAIEKAHQNNVPADNIKRAIDKAAGGGEGASLDEIIYEGYGPAGVAVMVECMTDNRNRTVSEIRNLFSRHGGNMGDSGCVSWMFNKRGIISFDKAKVNEEELSLEAIELGAEDIEVETHAIHVITKPEEMEKVRDGLKSKGYVSASAEITMLAKTTVPLDKDAAQKAVGLVSALEEHDDVQNVYANFDITDDILNAINS